MNNALDITGLSKRFSKFTLNNVNFQVPEGYIMGLIGASGAGKTTLIKLILNIIKKDAGKIKIFGLDHILREEEIKEKIGVVFEKPYYQDSWTLGDLEKAIRIFYHTWSSNNYHSYLQKFGLDTKQRIQSLSKGMKMKLMIAVALSHDTKLLILDEPTSGLDAVSRDELLDILRNYMIEEDKSVIMSSHITSDLEKIADYITLIHRGEIVFTGTKDGLLESYCIIKGDIRDINLNQKSYIIGYREYPNGFEGLVPISSLRNLSSNIITDQATLEDIILFTNREENRKISFTTALADQERM